MSQDNFTDKRDASNATLIVDSSLEKVADAERVPVTQTTERDSIVSDLDQVQRRLKQRHVQMYAPIYFSI
jgi:amino acid permease